MTPQEMQRRLYAMADLLDHWLAAYGDGCENAAEDEDPAEDCPCIYCTTIRVLEGQS